MAGDLPCRRGCPGRCCELYIRVEEVSERIIEEGADDTELVVDAVLSERLMWSARPINKVAHIIETHEVKRKTYADL